MNAEVTSLEPPTGTSDLYTDLGRMFEIRAEIIAHLREHERLKHLERDRAIRILRVLNTELGGPDCLMIFLRKMLSPLRSLTQEILGHFTARRELIKLGIAEGADTQTAQTMIAREPNIIIADSDQFMARMKILLGLLPNPDHRRRFICNHPEYFGLDLGAVAEFAATRRPNDINPSSLWSDLQNACAPDGEQGGSHEPDQP
jgi:hypothetical protein